MDQKAVVYKTIKGMARDMSASSGSNDFSYENYNIRITTRGKEDSLVVTNEKGTESNIIASREVIKTVNNIFVGKQPSFYNEIAEVDISDLWKYSYTDLYRLPNISNDNNIDISTDQLIPISEKEYIEKKIYNTDYLDAQDEDSKFEVYTRPEVRPDPLDLYDIYYKDNNNNYIQATETQYNDTQITLYTHKSIASFYTIKPINEKTVLSSLNDDICYAMNVEYPIDKTEPNELKVKGLLSISEDPTEKDNEEYHLLDNGEYTELIDFTIPIGKSNMMGRKSIKDIVLGGEDGYYKTNNHYDSVDDIDYENSTEHLPTDAIMSNWLPSYRQLYERLLVRDFEFNGFTVQNKEYSANNAPSFSLLGQNIFDKDIKFDNGKFVEGNFYSVGILDEAIAEQGSEKFYTKTSTNKLGFLQGYVLADKYPTKTSLTFSTNNSILRIPFYKKGEETTAYNTLAGYFEFKFNFPLTSYLTGAYNKKESIECKQYIIPSSGIATATPIDDITCSIDFGNYSPYSSIVTPVLSIRIYGLASHFASVGYKKGYNSDVFFVGDDTSGYTYTMYTSWGPLFTSNVEVGNFADIDTPSFGSENNRATTYGGFQFKVKEEGSSTNVEKTFSGSNTFLFGKFTSGTTYTENADNSGGSVSTTNGIDFTLGSTSGYSCVDYSMIYTQTYSSNIKSVKSLDENKLKITLDDNEADIVIVNTCSFIHDAEKESVASIFEMINKGKKIIKPIPARRPG